MGPGSKYVFVIRINSLIYNRKTSAHRRFIYTFTIFPEAGKEPAAS